MNISAFWTRKTNTIDIYLKSGTVIALTGVRKFAVKTNTQSGKITSLEWEIAPHHPHLLDIQADEIAAIVERK